MRGKRVAVLGLLGLLFAFAGSCQSTKSALQDAAMRGFPSYFSRTDEFLIIGSVASGESKLICVFNKHFWGNGRMSGRVVLFSEAGDLIGEYGVISDTPSIRGSLLLFPYEASLGNMIDLTIGIPREVRLDGELYSIELYKQDAPAGSDPH